MSAEWTKKHGNQAVRIHRIREGVKRAEKEGKLDEYLNLEFQKELDEWEAHKENRKRDILAQRAQNRVEIERRKLERIEIREQKEHSKREDAERARKRKADQRSRRDEIIRQAKEQPCAYCGGKFSICAMDFHHVRGKKTANISELRGSSLKKVEAEIKKCDVICANCHRKVHCPETI